MSTSIHLPKAGAPGGNGPKLGSDTLGAAVEIDALGVAVGGTRVSVGDGRIVGVSVGVSVGNVGVNVGSGEGVEANATMLVGGKTARCGGLKGLRNDWGCKKIAKYHRHVKIIKLMTNRVGPLYSSWD
jgi:hypothetical protein